MEHPLDIKPKLVRTFQRIVDNDIYDYQNKEDLRTYLIQVATEAIDEVLDKDDILNMSVEEFIHWAKEI